VSAPAGVVELFGEVTLILFAFSLQSAKWAHRRPRSALVPVPAPDPERGELAWFALGIISLGHHPAARHAE
jgi:hypothetical protein